MSQFVVLLFLAHTHAPTHHPVYSQHVSTSKKQMVVIKMKDGDNRFTFPVDLMGEIKSGTETDC